MLSVRLSEVLGVRVYLMREEFLGVILHLDENCVVGMRFNLDASDDAVVSRARETISLVQQLERARAAAGS
jgi:hypothetical protein